MKKSFALDIDLISKQNKISNKEIIKRHIDTIYSVYLIGFFAKVRFGNMDINSSLEAWLFFELSMNNSLSSTNIELPNHDCFGRK